MAASSDSLRAKSKVLLVNPNKMKPPSREHGDV